MADGQKPNGKAGGEDENKDVAKAAGFVVFSGIALSIIKALCPKKSIEEFVQSDDAVSDTSTGDTVGELKEDAKVITVGELKEDAKVTMLSAENIIEKTSEVQKEEKISEVQKGVIGFGSEITKKFQKQGTTKKSGTTIELIKGDTLWDLSQKYGVSIDSIKAANGLTDDMIYAGDKLIIPS
ncbi:uncharacterized protein LOC131060804 isoform X1 [Cryptomeria japonica]|uniref:uncharacterized protein LOC131060804 isoform X1 n=1 Tax=Cryptomeria japonica TaxID=3369 RepID=UPI0025AC6050|nr:uncharacterized protein LOC131060804 isoform X1 [Cryptomeria japonica]